MMAGGLDYIHLISKLEINILIFSNDKNCNIGNRIEIHSLRTLVILSFGMSRMSQTISLIN